MKKDNYVHD